MLITGTDGPDSLLGTGSDDTIIGAAGDDFINGAGGFDIAAYWTSPFGIVVRLFANTTDNDGFGGRDTLENISGIAGTGHDDLIYGSDLGNYIQGFMGNDTIFALGGDDLVRAGEGDDYIDGGAGTDRVFFLGNRADYTVTAIDGGFQITDTVADRYGSNTVLNFELFQFSDRQVTAAEILNPNAPGDGLPYPRDSAPPEGTPTTPTAPATPSGFAPATLASTQFGIDAGWNNERVLSRHLADVNGDGRADIIAFGNAGAFVALGDASGGFGNASLRTTQFSVNSGWANENVFSRHMADVNGDGRADIIGFGNAGAFVALGDASGGFANASLRTTQFSIDSGWKDENAFSRHMADVNGDGRADIVGFGNAGAFVALGDASGGFGNATLATTQFGIDAGWNNENVYSRHMADVNGDGRADIVGFGNAGAYVALGNASGGFGNATLATTQFGIDAGWNNENVYSRHLADVNGDGRADIIGFSNAGAFVALGDASGGFAAATLVTDQFGIDAGWANENVFARNIADVNGDGRGDIVGFGNAGVWVAEAGSVWG
ncbi:VCBS repeat-containing protein [Roseomonas stagni]|uniref:VCBS repeat-containing protein n=1 Tax=Falsiroseomonas algicola TaxID=2716930 RepID=A0A6M1LM80_9PROT|nr:VCBS repeat-containing protein [Falsiroseomonas algicola]NGM21465.1 VCBS repeat-containing protein [Falsiroseomonas algicola]